MRKIPRPEGPILPQKAVREVIEARIEKCANCNFGSGRERMYHAGEYKARNGRLITKCTKMGVALHTIVEMHNPYCPQGKWTA